MASTYDIATANEKPAVFMIEGHGLAGLVNDDSQGPHFKVLVPCVAKSLSRYTLLISGLSPSRHVIEADGKAQKATRSC
jgi:hypothetical protein